eukprot:TRINITY_DN3044_c0_g5_i2.p1 TRINITY_DN3044_c0_g5~~TRINITY_DN3044_c0_g5_i2.p1  ORF type:complete len:106 (-),score=21.23 TRINITY_DN3044_c0_g5_i2:106-423(-)
MALVMRIKFPPTYPLIYKTLRIDSNLTTVQAIQFISESLNVSAGVNMGLYLPQEKLFLNDNTPLSEYPQLQDAEEVEFRDKAESPSGSKAATNNASDKGGCCVIL